MNAMRRTIEDFLRELDATEEEIREFASSIRLEAVMISYVLEVIDFDQEVRPRVIKSWRVVQDAVQRVKQPLETTQER
jgi:hypothetical protein